jgi:hypothetical protein
LIQAKILKKYTPQIPIEMKEILDVRFSITSPPAPLPMERGATFIYILAWNFF